MRTAGICSNDNDISWNPKPAEEAGVVIYPLIPYLFLPQEKETMKA
jgi:hypothetical protein